VFLPRERAGLRADSDGGKRVLDRMPLNVKRDGEKERESVRIYV